MSKQTVRRARAKRIVAHLKKVYPEPKSELVHKTPFQFLVAVVMSAQCTDKVVNRVTAPLFKKYKTASDFAQAKASVFEKEISSVTFFRNKARHIIESAKKVVTEYGGRVPETEKELVALPGVGYKTAHVILNELYGVSEGIPTDTHVKRFAKRFDLVDSSDLKKISKELEALIPKKDWKYVNNGLVLYGRYVCKAQKHDCTSHPLTKLWPEANKRWTKTGA
ncbi:MAG: endonuclease III [Parcubacteria group bacterium Greene0714_7]|nr:MAG: endonuclease III [Parcubacteria group bacterium Greene0714_7]